MKHAQLSRSPVVLTLEEFLFVCLDIQTSRVVVHTASPADAAPMTDQASDTAPRRVLPDLGSATVRAQRRAPLGAAGGSAARSAPPSCNTGGKSR